MASRSKPVALIPVRTRTGTASYRVTGTIRGKQRKKQFMNLEDAEAQRDAWEVERMSGAAAVRPKTTHLTQAQLREAEAAFEMLKGTEYRLADGIRALFAHPPLAQCELTFEAAYKEFLEGRKGFMGEAQFSNYETVCRRFTSYVSPQAKLRDIDAKTIQAWLTSLDVSKKSWNNYRGDLTVVFNWFAAAPRKWLVDNPATAVPRFRKRDTLPGKIRVLTWEVARDLMHWLEREKPNWVTIFALALFAGIRPDRDDGEMRKLAEALQRGEGPMLFRGDALHLTAGLTKDGRPRRVPLPEITGMALSIDSIVTTAIACDTSESIIRRHYLGQWTKTEAHEFYAIIPCSVEPP